MNRNMDDNGNGTNAHYGNSGDDESESDGNTMLVIMASKHSLFNMLVIMKMVAIIIAVMTAMLGIMVTILRVMITMAVLMIMVTTVVLPVRREQRPWCKE